MKNRIPAKPNPVILSAYLFAVCLFLGPTEPAAGQTQGDNAVYDASSNCSNSSQCIPSPAFVDASVLFQTDICNTIYKILKGDIPSGYIPGGVIDARGITTPQTCANSPWYNGSVYLANKPATILLPAGVINIPSRWILPSGTRLIGEGADLTGSQQTVIRCSGALCSSSNAMIQFGGTGTFACPSSLPCTGISVEQLTLDGANNSTNSTVNGIENANSQDQTYVDHVTLWQFLGTGLYIHTSGAQNSGPYTNITYDTNGAASGTAVCVNINGVGGGTHGIRGLTCKSANYSPVAVFLDSSNNSLEDVRIIGFDDGIRIGSLATARSNVLFNILGDTVVGTAVINVIHILNNPTLVSDLSIVGVTNQGGAGTFTIQDGLTGTALRDAQVGMYVLGKQRSNVGYPRFTTSPNAAAWVFNAGSPPMGTGKCATGSLYSDNSSNGGALWVCDRTTAWVQVTTN